MITYEKFDDYYVFSCNPKTRIYLGDASPEDYIHDKIEQAKRIESCSHYVIATGEKVDGYPKGELAGETVEYKCAYSFVRRLSLSTLSGPRGSVEYESKNKAMERLAQACFFGQTLEEYDARQLEIQAKRDEQARKRPLMHNLSWVNGRTYYTNDDGVEISFEEHKRYMKEKFGDDVFEKAEP